MLQDNYEIEYSLFILFYTFKKLKWTKKGYNNKVWWINIWLTIIKDIRHAQ